MSIQKKLRQYNVVSITSLSRANVLPLDYEQALDFKSTLGQPAAYTVEEVL